MSGLPNFISELRRRNVIRVVAAYAFAAWLIIQVVSIVLPAFHAPDWIMQAFLVLVVLGFPVTVVLAWVFELTPVSAEDAERLAKELLADRALDTSRVLPASEARGNPQANEATLTVMRRDGVMDPVALSTVIAARELGIDLEGVRTARRVYCPLPGGPMLRTWTRMGSVA